MPQDFMLEAKLALLAWEASQAEAATSYVRTLRDYAKGEQPVYLTDRQKEYLGLNAKDAEYPYAHNICELVIDVLAERLHVTGFDDIDEGEANEAETDMQAPVDGETAPQVKPLSEYASDWFDMNRMDAQQVELYEDALRDGSAYIVVDWEPVKGYPRWTVTPCSDGDFGISVYIDPETNEVAFATKQWRIVNPLRPDLNGRKRLNVHYPGRVEKYIEDSTTEIMDRRVGRKIESTAWREWYDVEDGQGNPVWPLPWTEDDSLDGVPLGTAVVPFDNPHDSEISDVIPLQDMLNKADLDLAAAADSAGFRVYYVTGVDAQLDSSGNETAITIGPGRVARFSSESANFGAIEPADLEPIIKVGAYWIQSAAGVTRTPQHLFQPFGGTPPSGESLKEQEVGLVNKAKRRSRVWGNSWEDVVYLSARLWNKYMPGEQITIGRIQTVWDSVETRNELTEIQVATQKQGLNVPDEVLWAELGYDANQIEEFKQQQRPGSSLTGGVLDALMREAQGGAQGLTEAAVQQNQQQTTLTQVANGPTQ